jgi:hypothetical protein
MALAETKTEERVIDPRKNRNQRGEKTAHMSSKNQFSNENQQEYNRSTEVTALPPSFD